MSGRKFNHGFSVELKSKEFVKSITLSDDKQGVLLEGVLGQLEELALMEGSVLLLRGSHGMLMLDLKEGELLNMLKKNK